MATVLIITPHPDDEVLGAGGLIKKSHDKGDKIVVLTVSGHLPPLYSRDAYEITLAEAKKAHEILGVSESTYLEIPATQVVDAQRSLRASVERRKRDSNRSCCPAGSRESSTSHTRCRPPLLCFQYFGRCRSWRFSRSGTRIPLTRTT